MITVGIVGIEKWIEHSIPLMASIHTHEPRMPILYVNNGDHIETPLYGGCDVITTFELVPYAAAINLIIKRFMADERSNWLIILNNDVLCDRPFSHVAPMACKNTVWGNYIHERGKFRWVDGWLYMLHRSLIETVGLFDEAYEGAAFEDLDYSYRAAGMGFDIGRIGLPFTHFEHHSRYTVPDFWVKRRRNLNYFLSKHSIKREALNYEL